MDVPAGKSAIAFLQGLSAADEYLVEYQTTQGKCDALSDDAVYIPFSPTGSQWKMTIDHNPKQFDIPGVYRFTSVGAPTPTVGFDFRLYNKLVMAVI
jgi:hypothetical protein